MDRRAVLLKFLDEKLLDPILDAQPDQYSREQDRKYLVEVKKKAEIEKKQFHEELVNASDIKAMYFRNLYFETNSAIGKKLEDLELPRYIEMRNIFIGICDDAGV